MKLFKVTIEKVDRVGDDYVHVEYVVSPTLSMASQAFPDADRISLLTQKPIILND